MVNMQMVYMETNWATRKQKYEYVNKHDDNGNTHNENWNKYDNIQTNMKG